MELKTSLKCNSEICGSENLVQYILSLAASLIGGAWRYKGGTVDGFSGGLILSGHTETETQKLSKNAS